MYRNFGIRSTSRSESANAEFRNLLQTPQYTLPDIYKAIKVLVERKKNNYLTRLEREGTACRDLYRRNPLLVPITEKVS